MPTCPTNRALQPAVLRIALRIRPQPVFSVRGTTSRPPARNASSQTLERWLTPALTKIALTDPGCAKSRPRPQLPPVDSPQSPPRSAGQHLVDFDRDDAACFADHPCEDRRVVAGARAYVADGLAVLQLELFDQPREKGRVSVVEPAPGIDGDQYVVAQVPGIRVISPRVSEPGLGPAQQPPGTTTQERLARDGGECLHEPLRFQGGVPAQLVGVPAPLKSKVWGSLQFFLGTASMRIASARCRLWNPGPPPR